MKQMFSTAALTVMMYGCGSVAVEDVCVSTPSPPLVSTPRDPFICETTESTGVCGLNWKYECGFLAFPNANFEGLAKEHQDDLARTRQKSGQGSAHRSGNCPDTKLVTTLAEVCASHGIVGSDVAFYSTVDRRIFRMKVVSDDRIAVSFTHDGKAVSEALSYPLNAEMQKRLVANGFPEYLLANLR